MTTQIVPAITCPATLTDQQYDTLIQLLPTLYAHWEEAIFILKNISNFQKAGWEKWTEIITPDNLKNMTEKCIPFLVSQRLSTMNATVTVLLYQLAISAISHNLLKLVKDRYRTQHIIDPALTIDTVISHISDVKLSDVISLNKLRKLQKKINALMAGEWHRNLFSTGLFTNIIGDYAEVEMMWKKTFSINSAVKLIIASQMRKETFRMFKIGIMKKLEGKLQNNLNITQNCVDTLTWLDVSQRQSCNLIERVCWFDSYIQEAAIPPSVNNSNNNAHVAEIEQDLTWVEKLVS